MVDINYSQLLLLQDYRRQAFQNTSFGPDARKRVPSVLQFLLWSNGAIATEGGEVLENKNGAERECWLCSMFKH